MSKQQGLAKMDAMIAGRTTEQLAEMLQLVATQTGPDVALVRARIYSRLCDTVGEDKADEIYACGY